MATNTKRDLLLARQARERFVAHAARILPELANTIKTRLTGLMDQTGSAREMQERRDAWLSFQENQSTWVNGTIGAWKKALIPPTACGIL